MWDTRQIQPATSWASAAMFAATTLEEDQHAGVLIHCQHGRCRSVMVAYAVLRLRGHSAEDAADLILTYRSEALLVPLYRASVEQWLASIAQFGEG
jgi:protein-tyrosine phosphatase